MATELAPRYDASQVEQKWYDLWEQAGLFAPGEESEKPRYTVTIPPPNITGSLHMGHALCYPLQDLFGRYQRLRGKNVLILPGQDHAGIATQSVVDKQLKKEGLSATKIGREKFVERVWEWRKESGDTILNQLRRLGCAFDWSRTRFTLDEKYHDAVLKVFVEWFDRSLIFRGKRVVNWDPVLKTSVSDIETERRNIRGKLYYIRYPLTDGSGHITIATTRPETMLADVAIAVHPSDERYKDKVGKTVILPLMNREIPIVADIYPDPEFGSGAVKVTPAHDPNDYQIGVRHNLPMPVLLDESGRITMEGGLYAGLERYDARKRIVADLEELGFLEEVKEQDMTIIVSERSGEPIEPLLSEQWFADQKALAKPVIEAMKAGKIKFYPERYEAIFTTWLENIIDWTLSRQLWWGHRIPIYYTEDGTAVAALSWEEAERKAGQKIVSQDEDVLDTWFSSGLWPFATLGWPDTTKDLQERYPTDTLITDRNIIYLWVGRMAMMGLDFMKEVPFHEVYIYATVLTEDGRRMSKSLGTGVDPMGVIETKGADALRYTLLSQSGYNQDIRYSERRTEEARNFANKIWNATRFVLMNMEGEAPTEPGELLDVDKWLLSRLYETERVVRAAYDAFDVQSATQALYRFFWSELCDWYIEVSKSRLSGPERQTPQWVLLGAIECFLKMLHPVMPHITEEIYSHLPFSSRSPFLMSSSWPELPADFHQPQIEAKVERWFEIVRTLRALRAELELTPGKIVPVAYYQGDLGGGEDVLASQAWVESLVAGKPSEQSISSGALGVDVYLPFGGSFDVASKLSKLAKEEAEVADQIGKIAGRLENPQFVERAKPEAVQRDREALAELEARLERVRQRVEIFRSAR